MEWREQHTQKTMCDHIDTQLFMSSCIDRSYLGGVERGERNLTFGVLCAICAGLTCDLAAITKGISRLATPVFRAGSSRFSSRNGNGPESGS
jgi:transcriptional regulator with XRE-family HTH domain